MTEEEEYIAILERTELPLDHPLIKSLVQIAQSGRLHPTCSPAVVCRECGPACEYGEGDEIRPCVACGATIGHGAGQHTCEACGELCCTACSHDADSAENPAWQVVCDDCQYDHGCSCCEDGRAA